VQSNHDRRVQTLSVFAFVGRFLVLVSIGARGFMKNHIWYLELYGGEG